MTATRRPLRFVVDGTPVEPADVPPSTTLLDWLRIERRATATKEGCAEGDCGACTVVIARRTADGSVRVEPCNACIRLVPTLDGCGVLTAAGLGGAHPVQRAMVENHGSQCGFCTPGFVMAMTARLARGPVGDASQALDALAGNLCRCTGYRPIVAAMHAAGAALHPGGAVPGAGLPGWIAALPPPERTPLTIDAGRGAWDAPRTPEDVDALLAAHPDAWLLAGGTDVGLWVTKQLREPSRWVWLGAVDALRACTAGDAHLDIGAAVPLAEAFAALHADYPELERYWSRFASPAIRASGTLVGNLANGSPIGDAAPVLIALGAELVLRRAGERGPRQRSLPLADLYVDYRVQRREPGEWIERVRVPRRASGLRLAAFKVSRRLEQDISALTLAIALRERDGALADVRIACGGMAGTVRRAPAAERALEGRRPEPEVFERAGAALASDFAPLDDLRASRDYRLAAAAGLLVRAGHVLFGAGAHAASLATLAPVEADGAPR
jgi:xanthine dehydrogenase small subunit